MINASQNQVLTQLPDGRWIEAIPLKYSPNLRERITHWLGHHWYYANDECVICGKPRIKKAGLEIIKQYLETSTKTSMHIDAVHDKIESNLLSYPIQYTDDLPTPKIVLGHLSYKKIQRDK